VGRTAPHPQARDRKETALATGPEATAPPRPDPHSDDLLVLRVARRDRPAFVELFRRYVRPVYGLALSRIEDHALAEGVTRATFDALWRESPAFDPATADAEDWIHDVAIRAIEAQVERAPSGSVPAGQTDAASERRRWRVQRALATLTPEQSLVVELSVWGAMGATELARYVGLPVETVRTHARAGYARLAEALAEDVG
jgi:RNA polymerase sigma-70 factor (ECF subfamily)